MVLPRFVVRREEFTWFFLSCLRISESRSSSLSPSDVSILVAAGSGGMVVFGK